MCLYAFQVFLIIHYQPLVNALADVILNGDLSVFTPQTDIQSTQKNTVKHTHVHSYKKRYNNFIHAQKHTVQTNMQTRNIYDMNSTSRNMISVSVCVCVYIALW